MTPFFMPKVIATSYSASDVEKNEPLCLHELQLVAVVVVQCFSPLNLGLLAFFTQTPSLFLHC
jgi:hypothetical protein